MMGAVEPDRRRVLLADAALVLVLMAFLAVLMVYYLVSTVRQQKAMDR